MQIHNPLPNKHTSLSLSFRRSPTTTSFSWGGYDMKPTNNQQQQKNPFYDYRPFNAQAESLVGKFLGKGKFDFEETDMFVNGRTVPVDLTSIYNKCVCLHLSKLAVAHRNARNQGYEADLQFVEVVSAMAQKMSGRIMFNLIFDAIEVGKEDIKVRYTSPVAHGEEGSEVLGFTYDQQIPPPINPPMPNPSRGYRELTPEELAAYDSDVKNSDGFDVKETPLTILYGQIKPINLIHKDQRDRCEELAKLAIAAFNNDFKESEGELQFAEIVRAMREPMAGTRYYLTFNAINLDRGHAMGTYQAIVIRWIDKKTEVQAFRPEPRDDVQGRKEWYWDRRRCDGETLASVSADQTKDGPTPIQPVSPIVTPVVKPAISQVGQGKGKFKFDDTPLFEGGYTVPVDLTSIYDKSVCVHLSKLAIDYRNIRKQGNEADLQLVEVVGATAQIICGRTIFILTLDAIEVGKEGSKLTYKSSVAHGDDGNQVLGFKLDEPVLPPPLLPEACHRTGMTPEEFAVYQSEIEKMDVFDVKETPGTFLYGQIVPINFNIYKNEKVECEKLANLAIATFNEEFKASEGDLQFVELIRAMCQSIAGTKYYLTFNAINLHKGGERTYQAIVIRWFDGKAKVQAFRLEPRDDVQGSLAGRKEWYWDHRVRDQAAIEPTPARPVLPIVTPVVGPSISPKPTIPLPLSPILPRSPVHVPSQPPNKRPRQA